MKRFAQDPQGSQIPYQVESEYVPLSNYVSYTCDTKDSGNIDADTNDKGKSDDNPQGNQDDENIKSLQRKLTEKDIELKNLEKKLEESNSLKKEKEDEGKTEVQKLQDKISGLEETQAKLREDTSIKDLLKTNKGVPETIIRLLYREKDGNLEEVQEILDKQASALGVKKVETPKFTPAESKERMEDVKKDPKLSMDEKLVKLEEIRKNTK